MVANRRTFLGFLGAASITPACVGPYPRRDLYNCEGCEAVHERPRATLGATAQLAGPGDDGDRIILTGTVRDANTRRPANDIVIYVHHTNDKGLYADGDNGALGVLHGKYRGWARTGPDGVYTFNTIKPGVYPERTMPAHIHMMIGEPGRRPYYIDDVVFDGEFLVNDRYRSRQESRGGSGIVRLSRTTDGVWLARRDIVLELHPASVVREL